MKKRIKVRYAIEMEDDSWGDMLYKTLNEAKKVRNKYYKGSKIAKVVTYLDPDDYFETDEVILLKA